MNYNLLFDHIQPKIFVDIGAHIGNFTKTLVSKFPFCQCYMIEANPYCEKYIKTMEIPYSITALSSTKKQADFYIEKINEIGTGASIYKENTIYYTEGKYNKIKVTTDTLDSLDLFNNKTIDLIKIDTQGSEMDILTGGVKTLKRTNFILAELSFVEYNQNAPLIHEVVEKLRENHFRVHEILNFLVSENKVLQADFLFKKV